MRKDKLARLFALAMSLVFVVSSVPTAGLAEVMGANGDETPQTEVVEASEEESVDGAATDEATESAEEAADPAQVPVALTAQSEDQASPAESGVLVAQADNTYTDSNAGVQYTYRVINANNKTASITKIDVLESKKDVEDGSINLTLPSMVDSYSVEELGETYESGEGAALFGSSQYNSKLGSITVPASVHAIGVMAFLAISGHGDKIKTITFEENGALTEIPKDCFANMVGLTTITLPNSVQTIGTTAFQGCTSLKSITLPTSLTTIKDHAFVSCTGLSAVVIPEGVTTIEAGAFDDCTALTKVDIPNSVTTLGEGVFEYCSSLVTVNLGKSQEASQLATIGVNAFAGTAITSIALPNSLTTLGYTLQRYESTGYFNEKSSTSVFAGCENLETIVWPTQVSTEVFDTVGGFWDNPKLKGNAALPATITKIDDFAFHGCDFSQITIPNSVTSIGEYAFQNNTNLTSLTIPNSVTTIGEGAFGSAKLASLTIEDGTAGLRIVGKEGSTDGVGSGSSTFSLANLSSSSVIKIPQRVSYLGAEVFCMEDAPYGGGDYGGASFYLYNKDLKTYWDEDGYPDDPWAMGTNGTVYYPSDAAADSDIVKLKAWYENLDPDLFVDENSLKFVPFDASEPTILHAITGSVPAGAKTLITAGLKSEEFSEQNISSSGEHGVEALAIVRLDGYADYYLSPDGTRDAASLNADWSFTVTTADMTPLTEIGSLQVTVTGDYADEANVAIVDWNTGKIVRQGRVARALVYLADDLPAGTYTAIAYAKNDAFSRIATVADFEMLGFGPSEYAQASAEVPRQGVAEVSLEVPAIDTSKLSGVIDAGSLLSTTSRTVPESTFMVRAKYTMASGRTARVLKLSVPEGLEPVSAASISRSYGVADFDASTRTLTLNDLAGADQTEGNICIALKGVADGSYSLSASVTSDGVTVPLGSVSVDVTALELVVPEGALDATSFPVTVYAAPGTDVSFQIEGEDTGVSCTTNKVGRGTAQLTIPEDALSLSSYQYTVTANSAGGSVSDTVEYFYAALYQPKVEDFSFVHMKQRVSIVKDGVEDASVYVALAMPSHQRECYSPTWPFTATLVSAVPLEDTLTLELGMMDQSVRYETLELSGTEEAENGTVSYTYTGSIPFGTGSIDDDLTERDIPVRFDLVPQVSDKAVETVLPQEAYDAVKREQLSRLQTKTELPDEVKSLVKDLKELDGSNIFNNKWRHENWDKSSRAYKTLTSLSPSLQQEFAQLENDIAELYESLAVQMGNNKPITSYASLDDYLYDNYGCATGQDMSSFSTEGYRVLRDANRESVSGAGTPNAQGDIVAPEWVAMRYGSPTNALVAQDEGSGYTIETSDSNGNSIKINMPGEQPEKWWGVSPEDITYNGMNRIYDEMAKFDEHLILDEYIKAITDGTRGAVISELCNCPLESIAYGATILAHGDLFEKLDDNSIEDEWIERLNELERMQMMDKYYDTHAPGSICQKAIQQEMKSLNNYLADLMWLRTSDAADKMYNTVVTAIGDVASSVGAGADKIATGANHAAAIGSFAFPMQQADLKWKAKLDLALLQKYRAYREAVCRHDDFGKLHYKKPVKLDPSGYTYAGVEDERVVDVKATIYRQVGDEWVPWDEAAEWDEVNPQQTTEGGIFAWNVPEGRWKALFQKEGYEDTWSPEMTVLPEHTNVGINLLRATPPVVEASAVGEGYVYVDVTYDQYMQTSVVPHVTIDGSDVMPKEAGGALQAAAEGDDAWRDATQGHVADGSTAQLAKTLRIPLTGFAAAGKTLEVVVNDGKSYTDKTQVEPYTLRIEIPADAVVDDGDNTGGTNDTSDVKGNSNANLRSTPAMGGKTGKTAPRTADDMPSVVLLLVLALFGVAMLAAGLRERKE